MTEYVLLVPTGAGVGLTTVTLGLLRAFERQGTYVAFVKPIGQTRHHDSVPERSTALVRATTTLHPPEPMTLHTVEEALRQHQEQRLLEDIVGRVHGAAVDPEVVVIEGLVPSEDVPFGDQINAEIATALDARVIVVGSAKGATPASLVDALSLAAAGFRREQIAGCVVNRLPPGEDGEVPFDHPLLEAVRTAGMTVIGGVTQQVLFAAPRVRDIAHAIRARIINEGDLDRRVLQFSVAAMNVPHCLGAVRPGCLIVTPGDRNDVIMAACLGALNGVPLAGLLLTGDFDPDPLVVELGRRAFDLGLPMLVVQKDTLEAANALLHFDPEVPVDDLERIEWVMRGVADGIDPGWIATIRKSERPRRITPPAFRYRLLERARAANKRIVLPEGAEPRTIQAAADCQRRGIARCVLLGNEKQIRHVAADHAIVLPEGLEILEPEGILDHYVEPMVALRRSKGLTPDQARNALEDTIVLGTMMLAQGEVDGLVSGAIHTTAHTVRPAFQLIRTAPGVSLVSSVFFMCLPDQVLVYGDCAINPSPTAEELAEIALQSAHSAVSFGIEPRVALISYSTGSSGAGEDVDKVRRATEIARRRAPHLLIDGPLQYDAAVMPNVAAEKAPHSPVAGKASVLVFPDLNTGNTTYKAVQRSAHVVSIGPMLQGLRKPVNDLSRGALVEDIVYTIALTAIQAATTPQ